MPDDDYEVVRVGCNCAHQKIDHEEEEKKNKINGLLKEIAADIPNLQHGIKVEYVLSNIYKILKIMNGIE